MLFKIHASEVAALVGLNPYKPQPEAIQDCINRNVGGLPPLQVMKASRVCKENSEVKGLFDKMTQDAHQTTSNEEVTQKKQAFDKKIKDILVKPLDQKIKEAKNKGDTKAFDALVAKREKAVIDAGDVTKAAATAFNTNFGTRREESIGKSYEELTGMNVEKPTKKYTWDIVPGKVVVVGKFDGFAEDGTLVEIKQRTRRLFNVVKDYENVQVHVYMKMAQVETAHLVEKFEDKIMIHNIYWDDDFMIEVEVELERVVNEYFMCKLN